MAQDRTPRYAPSDTLIVRNGKFGRYPVTQYRAHPAFNHPPGCPISETFVAVELVTDHGSAWWGFERAYINSELRMVCIGFDNRCELRRKWDVAQVEG